jgi:penicillin-binding protein 1C
MLYVKMIRNSFCLLIFVIFLCPVSFSFADEGSFSKEDMVLPDNPIFLDRNGEVLRFMPDETGERHIWIDLKDVPDIVKNAFIAIEDERFYSHNGVDLIAIVRALKDNIKHGKIVSGASTITQQVVRRIYPHKRTYKNKIIEIFRSYRLEGILSKDEILEQYLNRIPMGNNIIGVELASWVYFNKTVSDVSVAEAAVLASLPKAPGLLNPYGKNVEQLLKRKNTVLFKMAELGYLSKEELNEALKYEIVFNKKPIFPNKAPHVVDLLTSRGKKILGIHHTTIDLNLQTEIEKILASHKVRLASRGARQAGVIVVQNPTMEVLASVGSISYSPENKGYNNGTTALRSAGSTVKPFLYALALEEGYTVSSLLEDVLRKYRTPSGNYSPDNFDRKEYGPVTMRVALGNSLNISAIKILEALDLEIAYQIFERVRLINDSEKGAGHYGLGLVVGNAEVSLEQLVTAYAILANGGIYRPLKYLLDEKEDKADTVFSKETAYIISDILSDPSARIIIFGGIREMDFPFRISIKTGTSTKYRDGWAVGYTPEYTVGIWTGNFEGNPTNRISGASGAMPIFKEVMHLLYKSSYPSGYERPENVIVAEVCGISGMKPGPHCNYVTRELFIKGTEPEETCRFHRNERYFHELTTNYAGWIYEKNKKVSAGSYRLEGFPRNLNEVFYDDSANDELFKEQIGIHIKKTKGDSEDKEVYSGKNNKNTSVIKTSKKIHYSIGKEVDDNESRYISSDSWISITYPLPFDRFILSDNNNQVIRLEAISMEPVKYVDWFIDGRHYAKTGLPYHVYWRLERGRHTIMAVAPDRKGDSVEIMVE